MTIARAGFPKRRRPKEYGKRNNREGVRCWRCFDWTDITGAACRTCRRVIYAAVDRARLDPLHHTLGIHDRIAAYNAELGRAYDQEDRFGRLLYLYEVEGLTLKQIGAEMGFTESRASDLLYRARGRRQRAILLVRSA